MILRTILLFYISEFNVYLTSFLPPDYYGARKGHEALPACAQRVLLINILAYLFNIFENAPLRPGIGLLLIPGSC
jgi:hypothetical protein